MIHDEDHQHCICYRATRFDDVLESGYRFQKLDIIDDESIVGSFEMEIEFYKDSVLHSENSSNNLLSANYLT